MHWLSDWIGDDPMHWIALVGFALVVFAAKLFIFVCALIAGALIVR